MSEAPSTAAPTREADSPESQWWRYVAPLGMFLALTAAEGLVPHTESGPDPTWYPILYSIKIAIVSVLAWLYRSTWRDLRPRPGVGGLALAVGIGAAVAVGWVGMELGLAYPKLPVTGERQAFDPYVLPMAGLVPFLTVRLYGLVILVPLIEELFWRSFLMRWLIDPDFERVPVGRVTWTAAGVTSVLFAAGAPGMAAGPAHGAGLGLAAPSHQEPVRLRHQPRGRQSGARGVRPDHPRLAVLVRHSSAMRC